MKFSSKEREKICNICGELTLDYTILDNAILCKSCVPEPKTIKNEKSMLLSLIKKEIEK